MTNAPLRPHSHHLAGALTSLVLLLAPWDLRAQDAAELRQRLVELEGALATMQVEIDRLRSTLEARQATDEQRAQELELAVDALTDELEASRLGEVVGPAEESRHGLAPAASKVYGVDRGVSIGGYGEMLYESFDAERDDGSRSSRRDQVDFLRQILYFGYKFDDRFVFNSEIEFEHASSGKDGEVSVEMAALDVLLRDEINLRAGLLLTPVGFINELHEPPIFLGARRPQVEQRIIPSTWRENGIGLFGEKGRWSYRAYLMNGLDASGFSDSSGIRGGRTKGSKSLAEDLALALRVDVEPVRGLQLGASGWWGGSGQDLKMDGEELSVDTRLWELHAQYRWRGLQLRGLFTEVEVDEVAQLNAALGRTGSDSIGERLTGWYGEVGFDVLAHRDTRQELTPYFRHESYDTQDRVPDGFDRDPANDRTLRTLGLAYKPHPNVVFKLDWQDESNGAGTGQDQLNFALGYLF